MRMTLAIVALVTTTALADPGWSDRAATFRARAAAERKRLKLDQDQAKKSYPTPEVRFGGGAACPGEQSVVTIDGHFPPGTAVGTSSPFVDIVKEELSPTRWTGTVKVKSGATESALFEVISPVSGISATVTLHLGCAREWVIDVKSGERLVVKVVDGVDVASGEWFKGPTSLGKRDFDVSVGVPNVALKQRASAEELARREASENQAHTSSAAERQQKLATQMQACTKLPPAQMGPCMQKYTAELQQLVSEQQATLEASQKSMAPSVGCAELQGTLEGKALSGQAVMCAGHANAWEPTPFTGMVK